MNSVVSRPVQSRRRNWHVRMRLCLIACVVACSLTVPAVAQNKRENFRNAGVTYDWVTDNHRDRLRTFITRPKTVQGKVPVVFFVGWLSCDSVEYPNGETDGFGAIFWRVIEQSGYATIRMDKPGVGESQGNCAKTDFFTELSGYQAAFLSISKYDFVDLDRIFVVGLSNGGGTSALVPSRYAVRGYIAASSWGRTWFEHMLELERLRLTNAGKSPGEVDQAMKVFAQFYDQYLNQKMTPGEVIDQHPAWKSLWYDERDGQYGRPAAFYQQLQALNLGEAWQKVSGPVLVMHGTADTIMSDADSRAIAEIVNRTHPGQARYVEINGGDHVLTVNGKLEDSVATTMIDWMREHAK
jgi:pimeloyl-ACP methyl ester carboxylesterase